MAAAILANVTNSVGVLGSTVKVGGFLARQTTGRRVDQAETNLQDALTTLEQSRGVIDEDEMDRLISRYDILVVKTSCFLQGGTVERIIAIWKAHKLAQSAKEFLKDAKRSSAAARRTCSFPPNRPQQSESVRSNELEDGLGTVASRKDNNTVGKPQPVIPLGLLRHNPGRQSSIPWKARLFSSRHRGSSTEVPNPFLTTAERDFSPQTSIDLCRCPSISSSVFWNGHADTDSGI